MQRFGAFLWSGDVDSSWETLKTHVPVAINTSLTGIPYWGTDTGGFVPTQDLTGELYVRWFQFGAFCPLFRSHGRTWKLRLPWGWNTGELGPNEIRGYGYARNPGVEELHNASVEPICRKYLELRYQLLPYLYSVVRECCLTGLPIIRALWLHDADDTVGRARGDEYLWGPNILVAPVTEKGATKRTLYLPRGRWYDFWTGEPIEGGREITRDVDLSTLPLYVRAGTILPIGPVKQFTAEESDSPLTLRLYPGADGRFLLYEDDGLSFTYRKGDWMGIELGWNDQERRLTLRLADGSRMRPPLQRKIEVQGAARKNHDLGRLLGKADRCPSMKTGRIGSLETDVSVRRYANMNLRSLWAAIVIAALPCGLLAESQPPYQTDFPPDEFRARWNTVFDRIGDRGVAIVVGAPSTTGFLVPRQTNEFYHLCGIETPHAYLVLDGRTRKASLFLPPRNARLESAEGKVLSAGDAELVKSLTGVSAVASTRELAGDGLQQWIGKGNVMLFTPFAPGERNAECRDELRSANGASRRIPGTVGCRARLSSCNYFGRDSRTPRYTTSRQSWMRSAP